MLQRWCGEEKKTPTRCTEKYFYEVMSSNEKRNTTTVTSKRGNHVQLRLTLQYQISNCSCDSTANRILSLLHMTWTRVPAACAEANTFGHPTGKYMVDALDLTDGFD